MAKICLLDNGEFALNKHKNLFLECGADVKTTLDPDGLYALLDKQENFDLIILDDNLGAEDGLTILKNIKAKFPNQKLIVTTVEATDEREKILQDNGAISLIKKPITVEIAKKILDSL